MPNQTLRRLRRDHMITQAELAVLAGVQPPTVSRIESGTRGGDFRVRRRIAAALNVPVELIWPDEAIAV